MLSRALFANRCTRNSLLPPLARAYASGPDGPNHAILDLLKRNMDEENQNPARNAYKVRAFATAIKVIHQLDHPIRSVEDTKNLKGIGPGISRRIQEHLHGKTYVPNEPESSPEFRAHEDIQRKARAELCLVSGIGAVKAKELVDAGCMHIFDLHQPQYRSMLTTPQQIGLDYFEHLQRPVQREESETVAQFIRDNISSKFEVHLAGSYRRGFPTSTDIDVVLFHPSHVHIPTPTPPPPASGSSSKVGRKPLAFRTKYSSISARATSLLLQDVVTPLEERGLLAATLSSGARKWQGVVLLPERRPEGHWADRRTRLAQVENKQGQYRRMDLNMVPLKSRGAALLALTGDAEFNRDIRTKATKLGMHLNEFGLWRWKPDDAAASDDEDMEGNGEKGFWELVRAETEEEILRELGMEYVEPEKRNFSFVVGKTDRRKQRT